MSCKQTTTNQIKTQAWSETQFKGFTELKSRLGWNMFFQMLQILEELGDERGMFLSCYAIGKYLQIITVGFVTCRYCRVLHLTTL